MTENNDPQAADDNVVAARMTRRYEKFSRIVEQFEDEQARHYLALFLAFRDYPTLIVSKHQLGRARAERERFDAKIFADLEQSLCVVEGTKQGVVHAEANAMAMFEQAKIEMEVRFDEAVVSIHMDADGLVRAAAVELQKVQAQEATRKQSFSDRGRKGRANNPATLVKPKVYADWAAWWQLHITRYAKQSDFNAAMVRKYADAMTERAVGKWCQDWRESPRVP